MILVDSLDIPLYKTTVQQIYVYMAFRENLPVSTEARLILNKLTVFKILHIQINVMKRKKTMFSMETKSLISHVHMQL